MAQVVSGRPNDEKDVPSPAAGPAEDVFERLSREEVRRLLAEGREVQVALRKMAQPLLDIGEADLNILLR